MLSQNWKKISLKPNNSKCSHKNERANKASKVNGSEYGRVGFVGRISGSF